ncbi:response regulator [Novosphingobium album (ex Liu et al. 2023)]|uniref:Response regulator n=1 Tax=Novosphingobium album (ex Liu et al. 2023) TaxID=3031130 RepID=A0ABT5WKD3_9SPHN|nr:response regulator [Novosphingobium album (ex Liu et al. 2023)]MDE8650509.1 response regulator [Novosphingobium album (ex Liu et al. 2023)]
MTANWRTRLGAILHPQIPPLEGLALQQDEAAPPPEPVLIVDDDADWGNECAFSLRALGYEPLVALDPDEAVKLFLSHEISIAIVDYNMPGRDGIELIHELSHNAEAQGRRLHFIMATGYATKDIAIDAMRASAVDFLEKPIHQSDLRRALQRIRGLRDTPAARETLLHQMSSLSSELHRLARLIDEPGHGEAAAQAVTFPEPRAPERSPRPDLDKPELADFIRELLRKETKRRGIGAGVLFGDPAWEMLLDLLLARIEGRRVSVSSACIASGAPMSTALRLVRRLVDENVLCRIPDEKDRRRHFLIINPKFEQPLIDYLADQLRQRMANEEG